MKSRLPRPSPTRTWRIAAGVLAGLLITAAVLLGALRLLVAQVPAQAGRVTDWVERQTQLRVEYRALDARLRWFGPEVVLKDVRVLDRDGTQALFATREASVGLDLWNFLRTGQFVAGRVRFDGPDITVVRLADGRIRLLGQQERPADRPPFDLDRLPAGLVIIENATVTYRDLKAGRGPWRLVDLGLTLRRDRDDVKAAGAARLPARLGGTVEFSARLQGSLDEFTALRARLELRASRVSLAGWSDFLPSGVALPRGGEGAVNAMVAVADGRLQQARANVDLVRVVLDLPGRVPAPVETVTISAPHHVPGEPALKLPVVDKSIVQRPAAPLPRQASYPALAGDFRLRRDGEAWVFRVNDLRVETGGARGRTAVARLGGRLRGNLLSAFDATLYASSLQLAPLWPLVLGIAPRSFDQWAGLDPVGEVRSLRLDIVRPRAGAVPDFAVSADVAGLGVRPVARWPGISGLTASLSGTDEHGRFALRASDAALSWPSTFAEPLAVRRVLADIDWARAGQGWVIGSRAFSVEHELASARGSFELRTGIGRDGPLLAMTFEVGQGDVRLVPKVLPVARMQPRTLGWFERAFEAGQVTHGRVALRGPLRAFPFRNGAGDFTASAEVSGLKLVYFDGFAPLVDGAGTVDFHNAGLQAHLHAGDIGGLRLSRAEYAVNDYRAAVMTVDAAGAADLSRALVFLQGSPLGPQLGRQFMSLSGSGPAEFTVSLTIPTAAADQALRDHHVHAVLKNVAVTWPTLRVPAQRVVGDFDLHKTEVRAAAHGVLLDGPFELSVAPGGVAGDGAAALDFRGAGHLVGAGLPAFIGLPAGIRMNGGADWQLDGRLERRGAEEPWLSRFDVASTLEGLQIIAPQPFAKAAADPRPTRVRIEAPAAGQTDVAIESGSARARLRFVEGPGGRSLLERGLARFDGQPATLPARPGLQVVGDWPHFDLGEWLALRSGEGGVAHAADWLGPVDVHLDRAIVAGFQLQDVDAHLRFGGDIWRVGLTGPMAEGDVGIPADLSRGQPITLDMKRLQLEPAPASGEARGTPETDPRTLPALAVDAEELSWQGRHFGRVQARISKDPQGLRFDSLVATAPDFTLRGKGSWLVEGAAPRTGLEIEFASSDLAAASRSLGYNDAVEAKRANLSANLVWAGGPARDALRGLNGTVRLELHEGQLRNVKPGAGRLLGLMSVVELPRRLALDFHDVTDKGLAFNTIHGDFEVRNGSAYTQNLLLKGPAVDIGIVGRTGLATEDFDQTMVVSGNPSGPLAVAGALAAGPVIGAGVLVFSQLFKGQLQGLTRVYYHVTGPWSNPVVERISATAGEGTPAQSTPQKEARP